MAEVALAETTEQTPPNDEVLETPNPAPEATPPAEDTEDAFVSPFSDDEILKEAGLVGDADGTGDGAGAASDGRMPSEYEGKSAQEIEQLVLTKAKQIAEADKAVTQTTQYYEGLRKYVTDAVKEADRLADLSGSGVLDREWVKNTLNAVKGDYEILKDYDVNMATQNASQLAAQAERQAIGTAVGAVLGPKLTGELFKTPINDPKVLLENFGEFYAKPSYKFNDWDLVWPLNPELGDSITITATK